MSTDGSRTWIITGAGAFYRGTNRGTAWERLADVPFRPRLAGRAVANPFDPHAIFVLTTNGDIWAYREPIGSQSSE
jgi:hypothetical protein